MWTLRSGVVDPVTRNLDELYREYYEESVLHRLVLVAAKEFITVKGEKIFLQPLAPFLADSDRAGIDVRFKGLSPEALTAFDLVEAFYGSPTGKETVEELTKAHGETRKAKKVFFAACYQEITGLVDDDGSPIFSTVDVVEEFGLLDMLCRLGRWWHGIPSARKKLCGRPAP